MRRFSTAAAKALAALRRVDDPLLRKTTRPRDVVSTGLAEVSPRPDGSLAVSLDVRTAAHPRARDVAEACSAAIEHSGCGGVEVDVTLRASGFGAAVGAADGLARVRSCVAVASCKGGVGKSTVCANLAFALAAKGARVGVVDADVHGPSVPTLLGLEDATVEASPAGGGLALPVEHRGVRFASAGFANVRSASGGGALRGPLAGRVAQGLFSRTDWGELDYLLVDLPPGVGDVTLAVCAEVAVEGAVLVTTPSRLARADVVRGLALQDELGVPTLAVVENMAVFNCDNCGEAARPLGDGHAFELAAKAGVGADGVFELPLDARLAAANETGGVGANVRRPAAFAALADRIVEEVYNAMHARKDRLVDVRYDASANVVRVRRFLDGAADEFPLSVEALRKARGRAAPADATPTRVALVGNRSVVFDWSDRVRDDVFSVDELLEMCAKGSGAAG